MRKTSWDVFISYARLSSASHARDLRDAVAAAGHTIFLDEEATNSGELFPPALAAALLSSRVVVLFLSKSYFDSAWCVREYELAVSTARGQVGPACLSHVVVALPPDDSSGPMVEHLAPELARQSWPKADQTKELVELIARKLEEATVALEQRIGPDAEELARSLTQAGEVPRAGDLSQVRGMLEGLPPSLKDRFVGRSNALWRVFHLMQTRRAGGAPISCLVHALGGMGKTQLAAEYVWRYGPSFYPGGIVWIHAGADDEMLVQQRIQRALNVFGGVDGVRMAAQKGPFLWVVDDVPVEALKKGLDDWCPARNYVALLCTSRHRQVGPLDDAVCLNALDTASAVDLLTDAPVKRSSLPEDDWTGIAKWVGHLPLALTILRAGLAGGFSSAEQIRKKAQGQEPAMALDEEREALRGEVPEDSIRGVAETFHSSYVGLGVELQDALRVIAWARGWADIVQDGVNAKLANRGWLQTSGTGSEEQGKQKWMMHPVVTSYLRGVSGTSALERAWIAGWILGLDWKRPEWMIKQRDRKIFYGQRRGGVDMFCAKPSRPFEEELRLLLVEGIRKNAQQQAYIAATVSGALGDRESYRIILSALKDSATRTLATELLGQYVSGATMQPPGPQAIKLEGGNMTLDAEALIGGADPELPQMLTLLFAMLATSADEEYGQIVAEEGRIVARSLCSTQHGATFLRNSLLDIIGIVTLNRIERLCARILEAVPEWPEAFFLRALAYEKAGKAEEAIRDYTQAITKDSAYAHALFQRGMVLNSLDRHEEALRDFEAYAALDAEEMKGHLQRGACLAQLSRWSEALVALDTAIRLQPDYPFCWSLRAYVYLKIGNTEAATRDAGEALRLDAEDDVAKQVLKDCGATGDSACPPSQSQSV